MPESNLPLDKIRHFCDTLINQEKATPIVMPQASASGFWFGGGNMIQDEDGHLLLVGRYRNEGDSRTGIAAGSRGLELAVFRSTKPSSLGGKLEFAKVMSWSKLELNCGDQEVLSIEGSCLRRTEVGYQLFVSTEKANIQYPSELASFQKPGAGVWTIDVLQAKDLSDLKKATVHPCFHSDCAEHLHVKDPFFWNDGEHSRLGFCSHPFNWSSSNTGYAALDADGTLNGSPEFNVVSRGTTWDVAMTRGTCVLPVPAVGAFADQCHSLLFYCGGECVRELSQHPTAVTRPRGFSCEEIGGALLLTGNTPSTTIRISKLFPLFISPYGSGCSRYVDVCETAEGYFVTWQQSQDDQSQPLVINFVTCETAESCLW